MKESFETLIDQQIRASRQLDGSNVQIDQIILHLIKEVIHLGKNPYCLKSWTRIIIIGVEGAWRNANASEAISKSYKNEIRDILLFAKSKDVKRAG